MAVSWVVVRLLTKRQVLAVLLLVGAMVAPSRVVPDVPAVAVAQVGMAASARVAAVRALAVLVSAVTAAPVGLRIALPFNDR
jgi:hypothetical protein